MLRAVAVAAALNAAAGVSRGGFLHPQVSVNQVDLWWRYLPGDRDGAIAAAAQACSRGFTVLRVAATAFWPAEMSLWMTNATAYWELFDQMVGEAGAAGCSLLASINWNPFLFSDLAQQPFSALLDPTSAARALTEAYFTQIVTRYATNTTIASWELGNELNLHADINMTGRTDLCAPGMGTPLVRTGADNTSTAEMIALQQWQAGLIRKYDTLQRPISSGHSIPRVAAEHLRASYYGPVQDWTPDTKEQFQSNLLLINGPSDWITIHVYPGADNMRWNSSTDPYNTLVLEAALEAAASVNNPLYLGEFGDGGGPSQPREFGLRVVPQLRAWNVSFATVWVWQLGEQNSTYSLYPGQPNDDALIAVMQQVNNQG